MRHSTAYYHARASSQEPAGAPLADPPGGLSAASELAAASEPPAIPLPGRRPGFASRPGGPRMTTRGGILLIAAACLIGNLLSDWFQLGMVGGACCVAGCVAAACYIRRESLLVLVVSPPIVFLAAAVCAEVITAQGSTLKALAESVAAGTVLTLASTAPWLFTAVLLVIGVAMARGLPQCVRSLRADLRARPEPGPWQEL